MDFITTTANTAASANTTTREISINASIMVH